MELDGSAGKVSWQGLLASLIRPSVVPAYLGRCCLLSVGAPIREDWAVVRPWDHASLGKCGQSINHSACKRNPLA